MSTTYLVIMTAIMKSQHNVASTTFTSNSKGSVMPKSKTSIATEKPHSKCNSTSRCPGNLFSTQERCEVKYILVASKRKKVCSYLILQLIMQWHCKSATNQKRILAFTHRLKKINISFALGQPLFPY